MAHTIEINKLRVAYRLDNCPHLADGSAEEDHQCESECTWMDGDRRTLDSGSTFSEVYEELSEYDREDHPDPVGWAAWYIREHHPEIESAPQMVNGTAPESTWLSGESEDPCRGDLDVDTTTIYLRGDWTDAERGQVFRAVTSRGSVQDEGRA